LATLVLPPFNLIYNDGIFAQIIATNFYGSSMTSLTGSGANVLLVPDAPISVSNNPSVTNNRTIGITWTPGVFNGGTNIIDYEVQYD
jgi:hypothetical protein